MANIQSEKRCCHGMATSDLWKSFHEFVKKKMFRCMMKTTGKSQYGRTNAMVGDSKE